MLYGFSVSWLYRKSLVGYKICANGFVYGGLLVDLMQGLHLVFFLKPFSYSLSCKLL